MAVGEVPKEARIGPSVKQAWTNMWPAFWLLLLFGLIPEILSGISQGDSTHRDIMGIATVGEIIGWLVGLFLVVHLRAGLIKTHILVSRGVKPTWRDYGIAFRHRYWAAIGIYLLMAIIIILVTAPFLAGAGYYAIQTFQADWTGNGWSATFDGGMLRDIVTNHTSDFVAMTTLTVAAIIVALYVIIRFSFAWPRFIDHEMSPWQAIKASWGDTDGRWWNVFGLNLMAIPLMLAGLLALGVGVFVSMVLVSQMRAVYWRSIVQVN